MRPQGGSGCRPLLILSVAAVLVSLAAPTGAAAKGFTKGVMEDHFTAGDPSVRAFWAEQGTNAAADFFRININWRAVTNGEPANSADPADPAYSLGSIDGAVTEAAARGRRILLTIYNTPDFAIGPNESSEAPEGTWKPDLGELRGFAQAVATRYSGAYATPATGPLPRVGFIEAWNEPNLSQYLTPQYTRKSTFAGDYYREMVNAVDAGVRASSNPGVEIVAGATAPYGDSVGGTRTRPLRFMRDFLCVDEKLKPRKNKACDDEARFDILSHHPITLSGGPGRSAIHDDDVAMPDMKHLIHVLRAAERHNTVAGARHPVWVTEFWWETNPPDPVQGVPAAKHARWLEESFHSLWKQGVSAAFWFLLVDEPSGSDGFSDLQSGLFYEDRTKKPAFTAFRFPFVVDRSAARKAKVWTIPPASGTLEIQEQRKNGFVTIDRVGATAQKVGQATVSIDAGKTKLRGVIAGENSLSYTVK